MSKHDFADCYFCGGVVEEDVISYMRKWRGEYLLIDNVPAGVCNQCGEKYFEAKVAEKMDNLMLQKEKVKRNISVPVIELDQDAA
jgi:YgiT-type zinc finger domain-containing protein